MQHRILPDVVTMQKLHSSDRANFMLPFYTAWKAMSDLPPPPSAQLRVPVAGVTLIPRLHQKSLVLLLVRS